VDSEPADSKDYSPPGQIYTEAPDGFHNVFARHTASVVGPATDRWGTWVTGLVPIQNPQTFMSGLATPDDARALVRKAVHYYHENGRARFLIEVKNPQGEFRKGDLYAFAYDNSMTMLAHPVKPELVGKNQINQKDWDGGKYFRNEIKEIALSKGAGWVDYEYENPSNNQRDPKTTYFERVDDLIICAGAYQGTGAPLAVLGMDINASTWRGDLVTAMLPPVFISRADIGNYSDHRHEAVCPTLPVRSNTATRDAASRNWSCNRGRVDSDALCCLDSPRTRDA